MADINFYIPVTMEEAVKAFEDRLNLPKEFYNKLLDSVRNRAFTVAHIAEQSVLERIRSNIQTAIETGMTFDKWKELVKDEEFFTQLGWGGERAWHAELVFRQNIQTAYQQGRYEQMKRVENARPYWRYISARTARTRASHAAMHGKIFRCDDPIWNTWYPPNGFNCLCTIQSLSERDMDRRDYKLSDESEMMGMQPDIGFRNNPAKINWAM